MTENDNEDIIRALVTALKSGEVSAVVIEALKEAVKEAIKEWMDGMFAAFGKWAVSCIAVAAFGGLVMLALYSQGWTRK